MIKSRNAAPRRRRAGALLCVLAAAALAGSAAGQEPPETPEASRCGTVIVARFDWPAAELAAALAARLLEDGYGCEATLAPASPGPALARLRAPAEADAPIVAPGLPLAAADDAPRIAAGGALFTGADRRAFAAFEWFAATRPQLENLADVAANPELFAGPGGGRPTLTLCPVDWPCHAEGLAVARAHGLDAAFELRAASSGAALAEELAAAHQDRRPWIGFYWAPSAAAAEFPLRFFPPAPDARCAETETSGARPECRDAFAPKPLALLFDARLAERAPAAAAALEAMSMPAEAVEAALLWRIENGASAEAAADRFLEAEPETWRAWLDAEAADRVAAALAARRGEPGPSE